MRSSPEKSMSHSICVVGGGLVGLVAALQLSAAVSGQGKTIALVARRGASNDPRTTAMLMPAIDMLDRLGVWEAIKPLTAPLRTMRLIDGSKRLIRAPLTDFNAGEIGQEAFGYNVPNADMIAELEEQIEKNSSITRFDALADVQAIEAEHVRLMLDDGETIETKLVVAADGRQSVMREAAGITTKSWSYPQTALVLTFSHSLPHNDVSAEFHTETGPFTQVPLPRREGFPNRSSLVWLIEPHRVEDLMATDLDDLSRLVENGLQSSLGKCHVEAAPAAIPMSGMSATRFGANRTVLVGETGHVFPPIGAQGFNLGVSDVADLAAILENPVDDPGSHVVTDRYNRKRLLEVPAKTAGIDLLNRSLLTDFLPVQFARAAGLSMLGAIPGLKKLAMWQGMGSSRGVQR